MSSDHQIENAKAYIQDGRYEDARRELDEVLFADAANASARFELAKLFMLQGNDASSENEYLRVLSLDKDFVKARLELARMYYRQGRVEQSLEQYRQVTCADENNAEAYRELGKLCEGIGLHEKSLANLEAAARLCPEDAELLFDLARARRETGKEPEAAALFRQILRLPAVRGDKFLHNKALNELEITERKEVLESKVRAMIAMVTDKCNIKCRICNIWKGSWQARDSIMREIVDLFPYMEDICWEGGEVFMMKGFDDILEEGGKHSHLKQVIFTNGLLITEKLLQKISRGRADIVFSIDAVDKETYEYIRRGAKFERLIQVLELVKEFRKNAAHSINIYFNPIIMKCNYRQVGDFLEFGKHYEFNAVTFTPVRGAFDDENIFESNDREALGYLRQVLPGIMVRAKEYGVRLNNWLPVAGAEDDGQKQSNGNEQPSCCAATAAAREPERKRMICYAPWQRLTIDSGGPARPFAFCLNKFIGSTNDMSLAEIWNGEGMRWYRRKIANNDYRDLCQPECISGQVRDKICRIE